MSYSEEELLRDSWNGTRTPVASTASWNHHLPHPLTHQYHHHYHHDHDMSGQHGRYGGGPHPHRVATASHHNSQSWMGNAGAYATLNHHRRPKVPVKPQRRPSQEYLIAGSSDLNSNSSSRSSSLLHGHPFSKSQHQLNQYASVLPPSSSSGRRLSEDKSYVSTSISSDHSSSYSSFKPGSNPNSAFTEIHATRRTNQKPIPPPKPPRRNENVASNNVATDSVIVGGGSSLSQSKSQRSLSYSSNSTSGWQNGSNSKSIDFGNAVVNVPPPEGYGNIKRSASNDIDTFFNDLPDIGGGSDHRRGSGGGETTRMSTFTNTSSATTTSGISSSASRSNLTVNMIEHEDAHSRLLSGPFSSSTNTDHLYDEIPAASNAHSHGHHHSHHHHGHQHHASSSFDLHIEPYGETVAHPSLITSYAHHQQHNGRSHSNKQLSQHGRSKSEHQPRYNNNDESSHVYDQPENYRDDVLNGSSANGVHHQQVHNHHDHHLRTSQSFQVSGGGKGRVPPSLPLPPTPGEQAQKQQRSSQQIVTSKSTIPRAIVPNTDDEYALVLRAPPPDIALKTIRAVIKPLFQEYKKIKRQERQRTRGLSQSTVVEDKFFSPFDSQGKKVSVKSRTNDRIPLLVDMAVMTDPVPPEFFENPFAAICRSSNKTSGGDEKTVPQEKEKTRSLKRSKHLHGNTGTAERRKKKLSLQLQLLQRLQDQQKKQTTSNHSNQSEIRDEKDHRQQSERSSEEKNCDLLSKSKHPTTLIVKTIDIDGDNDKISPSLSLPPITRSPLFDDGKVWEEFESIMASFESSFPSSSGGRDLSPHNNNSRSNSRSPNAATRKSTGNNTLHLPDDDHKSSIKKSTWKPGLEGVRDFLFSISLPDYTPLLVSHGFDDVRFMGSNVMEESDLKEIGIKNSTHISLIISSAKKSFQRLKLLDKDDDTVNLRDWLSSLCLEEYYDKFIENGFTDIDKVRKIWGVELTAVMDIGKLGHRSRILASLGERVSLMSDLGLDDLDFQLKTPSPQPATLTSSSKITIKRTPTPPKRPISRPLSTSSKSAGKSGDEDEESVEHKV